MTSISLFVVARIAVNPLLGVFQVDVVQIEHLAAFRALMMLCRAGLKSKPQKLWGILGRLVGMGCGRVASSSLAAP